MPGSPGCNFEYGLSQSKLEYTYFQNEICTEIPPRHLSLAFRTPDLVFSLSHCIVERREYPIFDLADKVCPGGRVVMIRRPYKLDTPANELGDESLEHGHTHLSFLSRLKSAFILSNTVAFI